MADLYIGFRSRASLPGEVEQLGPRVWVRPSPVWEHRQVVTAHWQALVIGESEALDAAWEKTLLALVSGRIDALDDVVGVHSGVYWHKSTGELGWWRDRFGRIPWQHTCCADVLASTDPDALRRQRPGAGANPDRLADFLSGGLSNDRADFSLGVERLRPGELAHRHNDRPLGVRRWRSPTWRCGASDQPATTHVRDQRLDTLGGLLRRNAQIIAEPGSWLALSGGLDSATLLALSPAPSAAQTFTLDIGQGEAERSRAGALARHLGARWEPVGVEARWPLRTPGRHLSGAGWGPHAHPDAGWFPDALSQLGARAAHPVKTLVTGHGADDMLWIAPRQWLSDRFEYGEFYDLFDALRVLGPRALLGPALSAAVERTGLRALREHHRPNASPEAPWRPHNAAYSPAPLLGSRTRFALFRARRLLSWNWEMIMRSLARIARQAGVQLHTPYLDAGVWDLSLTLTPEEHVEGGRQKAPLRRLTRGLLPEAVRRRAKLGSFDALVERGLAEFESTRALRLMQNAQLARLRVIDGPLCQHALADYLARPSGAPPWRGSWEIWRTLAAELWLQSHGTPSALP